MLANICIHKFLIGKISKVVPQLLTKGQLGPCTLPQAKLVPKLLDFDSVTSSNRFCHPRRQSRGDGSHEKTNMPSFLSNVSHPLPLRILSSRSSRCSWWPSARYAPHRRRRLGRSRPRGTPAALLADSRHSRPRAPPAGLLVITVSDLLRLSRPPPTELCCAWQQAQAGRDGRTSHDPESDPRRGEMEVRHPWRFCGSNRFLFCLSCLPALIF